MCKRGLSILLSLVLLVVPMMQALVPGGSALGSLAISALAEDAQEPTAEPEAEPTAVPTAEPTTVPTAEPTAVPTAEPTAVPTVEEPTAAPEAEPTAAPTAEESTSEEPTPEPAPEEPTSEPAEAPVESLEPTEGEPTPLPTETIVPEEPEGPAIDTTRNATYSLEFTAGWVDIASGAGLLKSPGGEAFATLSGGIGYALTRKNAGEPGDCLQVAFAAKDGNEAQTAYIAAKSLRPMAEDEIAAHLARCEGSASAVLYQNDSALPLLPLTLTPVQAAEPVTEPDAGMIAPMMEETETYHAGDIAVINNIIDTNGLDWEKWNTAESDTPPESWSGVNWLDEGSGDQRIYGLMLNSWGIAGTLDVTGLAELSYLYCDSNDLSAVNVSGLTNFTTLWCENNRNLKTINVSGCTVLEEIFCSLTNISTLDLSDCPMLHTLGCHSIPLKKLVLHDREMNVAVDPAIGGKITAFSYDCDTRMMFLGIIPKTGYIFDRWTFSGFDTNPEDEWDGIEFALPAGSVALTAHLVADASTAVYDAGDIAVINNLITTNGLTWEPWTTGDEPPESWEPYVEWSSDGQVMRISELCLINTGLTGALDLTGLTGLRKLQCVRNGITSLDVSGLPILTDVACQRNSSLTVLNAENCPELNTVDVSKNNLDTLNVTDCAELRHLACNNNNLTTLAISGCPSLYYLDCASNGMTTLDVSDCAGLMSLTCDNNNLTALDLSANILLDYLSCDNNQIAALDLSGCPDLSSLSCTQNNLSALNLSGFSSLVYLGLSDNPVTTLDVSGCDALKTLVCRNSDLSTLDVSGLSALDHLACNDNQLTTVDVTGCVALRYFDCSNNNLSTLNLSTNLALEDLNCASNNLTAVDVSQNPILSYLRCDGNPISHLKLVGGRELTLVANPAAYGVLKLEYISFSNYEIGLTPQAIDGYAFDSWGFSGFPAGSEPEGDPWWLSFELPTNPVTVTANFAEIVPLPTPQNLAWGPNATAEWDEVPEAEGYYTIALYYDDGSSESQVNKWLWSGMTGERLWLDLASDFTESGSYRFSVRAGLDYEANVSAEAFSPVYEYTAPAAIMGTATNLRWRGGYYIMDAVWDWPTDVSLTDGVEVCLYRDGWLVSTWSQYGIDTSSGQSYSFDWYDQMTEDGDYTFTVRMLSGQLTEKRNGLASGHSPIAGLQPSFFLSDTQRTVPVGKTATLRTTVWPLSAVVGKITWKSSNTAIATVTSAGVVKGIKAGTATITATVKVNGVSMTAKCTIYVGPIITKLALPATASLSLTKGATLTATITPSNAAHKTLIWYSYDPSVVTVSQSGVLTGKSLGTTLIVAETTDGSGKWALCTVTVGPSVTGVTLSKATAPVHTGKTLTLKATIAPSNAGVKGLTWSSSNTAIATVDSKGVVKGIKAGTATITVKTADGGKTATCKVTVGPPVTSVKLSKTSSPIHTGKTLTLKATIAPSNAANKAVTWTSSNTAVATVSSAGVVTGVKAGTATITAKTADGAKTATCKVTIGPPVTKVTLSKTTAPIHTGKTLTLKATITPSNAANKAVTWTTSNKAIATVSSSGVVKGVKAGTATITVKTADGAKIATCKVTVGPPVKSIKLSKTTANLYIGKALTLKATFTPSNAANKGLSWTSSNTAVATVSSAGVVTGVKAGTVTITAKTVDGAKKAICKVKVGAQVTGVTLSKTAAPIITGKTLTLKAAVAPSNALNKAVTWTSSNKAVATVTSAGVVKGVKAGTATITVKTAEGAKIATCKVTVGPAVTGVTLNNKTAALEVGATFPLTATIKPSNAANKALTWTTSDDLVATVDNTGLITAVDVGTAVITVKTADGAKTATCTVTVNPSP